MAYKQNELDFVTQPRIRDLKLGYDNRPDKDGTTYISALAHVPNMPKPRDVYLHSDGQWHWGTRSDAGFTGLYENRKVAEKILQHSTGR